MSDVVDQKSVLSRLVMFLYRLEIVAPFLTCMLVQNVLNQSASPIREPPVCRGPYESDGAPH